MHLKSDGNVIANGACFLLELCAARGRTGCEPVSCSAAVVGGGLMVRVEVSQVEPGNGAKYDLHQHIDDCQEDGLD